MSAKSAESELNYSVEMFKKYRNLLSELTRKNVKLKYRNSWLGIFWSFLQPLLNMIVLSAVFSNIFGGQRKGIACYPVYLFAGRLMFDFFSTATKQAMTSFRVNSTIIKKVYVPKYMYPLSSIFSSFVTLAISLLCYAVVWIFFKFTGVSHGDTLQFSWHILLMFVPMILILMFSTGVGLILSVLCVYFRDIEYIWGVFTTLLFYMVPILYSLDAIKKKTYLINIIKINPLYHMIELFRQCVLYGEMMHWRMLLYAFITSFVTLIIGMIIFNWKSDDIIYHL